MGDQTDLVPSKSLLSHVDLHTRNMLQDKLEPIHLPAGTKLVTFGKMAQHAYFPLSGFAAVIARSPQKIRSEIGLIGREGMAPVLSFQSAEPSLFDVIMKTEGHAYQIEIGSLQRALDISRGLRELTARYVEAFFVQIAYTYLATSNHSAEERMARCLLMCHDRAVTDAVHLTHSSLSAMVGIKATEVTGCLDALEARHLIRAKRSRIIVNDRTGLEAAASDCYGRAEYAYRRLIGEFR